MQESFLHVADPSVCYALIDNWDRSDFGVLTGESGAFTLAHKWISHLLIQDNRVHIIDCAIRFDVFKIIDEATLFEFNADEILDKGSIQRAFTPYQILDVTKDILKNFRNGQNEIYMILAPCKQFFDGDVGEEEGFFLLNKLISVFCEICKRQIPFLVIETKKYRSKTFGTLFPELLNVSKIIWSLSSVTSGKEEFPVIEICKKDTLFGNHRQKILIAERRQYGADSQSLFMAGNQDNRQIQGIQKSSKKR